jgi:hypothetical protein
MRFSQYAVLGLAASLTFGLCLHEALHFCRFGHFCPSSLHVDVTITTSAELLSVEGPANIYEAKFTNLGILPKSIVACDLVNWASQNQTEVLYIVERHMNNSGK